MSATQHESRAKFLEATLKVVRVKGYAATRVEDICAEAGLTKGSFFHHFKSKEELMLAAMAHWDSLSQALFAGASYHTPADPLDRLIAYVALRKSLLSGELWEFSCFAGTIVQEAYCTDPGISAACERTISGHARTLEADITAAMRKYRTGSEWTPESLALHIQAVIQGGFILAKAKENAATAAQSLDHLRRYLELLFRGPGARLTRGTRRFPRPKPPAISS